MTSRSTSFFHATLSLLVLAASCALDPLDPDQAPNFCDATEPIEPLDCGVGACRVLVEACANGQPSSCPLPFPQQEELCSDGIDNNCDGQIDESCPCDDGQEISCFSGSPIRRQIGACRNGVQVCQDGSWSPCVGDVLPAREICDQLDNDCDGVVDETCPCAEGAEQACYGGPNETIGIGPCKLGNQVCAGGAWGDCAGDVVPQIELCDGSDNDCNGVVDIDAPTCACPEGEVRACYEGAPDAAGIGECAHGTQACEDGNWVPCEGSVLPQPEICNAKDDDCDGAVDNGVDGEGLPCAVPGVFGACLNGTTICGAQGVECQQNIFPATEACDGLDNDCNGLIDNGNFCCPDGLNNGNESDIDCGGPDCQKCGDGNQCNGPADCESNICTGGVCTS